MVRISPTVFAASLIAIAAADSSPVVGRAGSGLLHARQNLQFPDSCISLCQPISQTIAACPDANCATVCTTENENAFHACLECVVAAESPSANAQVALNGYIEFCAKNGPANLLKRQAAAATTTATTTATSASASVSASASTAASSSASPIAGVSTAASSSAGAGTGNSIAVNSATPGTGNSASTASGTSPSGSTATTSTSTTAPATTSASKSGAIGVRARAEVLSILFSLSLMAVLLL